MRIQPGLVLLISLVLAGCGTEPKPAPETAVPKKAEVQRPPDESGRFPKADLVETKVVDDHLMGKAFMPGGTVAHYKKGKLEYDMFVTRLASATDAAILLPDWRKALTDSKLAPSFGGYYGSDAGRPLFVFTKGPWVAGVAGLPQKDADLHARVLAAALN